MITVAASLPGARGGAHSFLATTSENTSDSRRQTALLAVHGRLLAALSHSGASAVDVYDTQDASQASLESGVHLRYLSSLPLSDLGEAVRSHCIAFCADGSLSISGEVAGGRCVLLVYSLVLSSSGSGATLITREGVAGATRLSTVVLPQLVFRLSQLPARNLAVTGGGGITQLPHPRVGSVLGVAWDGEARITFYNTRAPLTALRSSAAWASNTLSQAGAGGVKAAPQHPHPGMIGGVTLTAPVTLTAFSLDGTLLTAATTSRWGQHAITLIRCTVSGAEAPLRVACLPIAVLRCEAAVTALSVLPVPAAPAAAMFSRCSLARHAVASGHSNGFVHVWWPGDMGKGAASAEHGPAPTAPLSIDSVSRVRHPPATPSASREGAVATGPHEPTGAFPLPQLTTPIASYPPLHASRGPVVCLSAGVVVESLPAPVAYPHTQHRSQQGEPPPSAGSSGGSSAGAPAKWFSGSDAQGSATVLFVGAAGARGWRPLIFAHRSDGVAGPLGGSSGPTPSTPQWEVPDLLPRLRGYDGSGKRVLLPRVAVDVRPHTTPRFACPTQAEAARAGVFGDDMAADIYGGAPSSLLPAGSALLLRSPCASLEWAAAQLRAEAAAIADASPAAAGTGSGGTRRLRAGDDRVSSLPCMEVATAMQLQRSTASSVMGALPESQVAGSATLPGLLALTPSPPSNGSTSSLGRGRSGAGTDPSLSGSSYYAAPAPASASAGEPSEWRMNRGPLPGSIAAAVLAAGPLRSAHGPGSLLSSAGVLSSVASSGAVLLGNLQRDRGALHAAAVATGSLVVPGAAGVCNAALGNWLGGGGSGAFLAFDALLPAHLRSVGATMLALANSSGRAREGARAGLSLAGPISASQQRPASSPSASAFSPGESLPSFLQASSSSSSELDGGDGWASSGTVPARRAALPRALVFLMSARGVVRVVGLDYAPGGLLLEGHAQAGEAAAQALSLLRQQGAKRSARLANERAERAAASSSATASPALGGAFIAGSRSAHMGQRGQAPSRSKSAAGSEAVGRGGARPRSSGPRTSQPRRFISGPAFARPRWTNSRTTQSPAQLQLLRRRWLPPGPPGARSTAAEPSAQRRASVLALAFSRALAATAAVPTVGAVQDEHDIWSVQGASHAPPPALQVPLQAEAEPVESYAEAVETREAASSAEAEPEAATTPVITLLSGAAGGKITTDLLQADAVTTATPTSLGMGRPFESLLAVSAPAFESDGSLGSVGLGARHAVALEHADGDAVPSTAGSPYSAAADSASVGVSAEISTLRTQLRSLDAALAALLAREGAMVLSDAAAATVAAAGPVRGASLSV